MTSPDPVAVLREDCRAAAEDVLAAIRMLDHLRRRLEAHLATLAELDPAAADALERELHRRLAARDLFPSGRPAVGTHRDDGRSRLFGAFRGTVVSPHAEADDRSTDPLGVRALRAPSAPDARRDHPRVGRVGS